ncbi:MULTISPECIES: type IV toxin-antitoxin system AbiEi family antitoxin domain-containing protein [unclassified Kribbella]|uniref:type IV toxin-antitoxin system AbiEi family antitoxin domain-containing protein n=1 Tax=unclassified Kribbella TaxID=2644121 RepID=UPI00301B4B23
MNPKLKVISDGRRGWFNRSDVLAAGYSDAELRRRLRGGQWIRLGRDAFVEHSGWPEDEKPWDRARRLHLLAIRAVTDQLDKVVVSHQSAAVLHGLPIWGFDLGKVHVSRSTGRVRSGATLAVHRSPLDPDEVTELDGIRVTTVERAITETACGTSFEVGVVLADAALRAGLTSPELLIATADRHRHWRGSPAARSAVRFADGLSESVGESRLRVLMDNHQLPAPSLQVEIRANSGELIGRVDFLLSGRLIVEFDGAQKYGDSADTIVAEKWREDRLRDRGYGVVRVSWPDLDQPRITAARLHRHLLSGEPGHANLGHEPGTSDIWSDVRGPREMS